MFVLSVERKIKFLERKVSELEEDARKVDNGNKAACTRVRVGLMSLMKAAKSLRDEVLAIKKG